MGFESIVVRAAAVVLTAAFAATASAASQRTLVASSGNDANPCSLPQPCRSFATAIGAHATNGVISVKNSVLRNNFKGFKSDGTSLVAILEGVTAQNNVNGIFVSKGSVTVNGSVLANNTGAGAFADSFIPGGVQVYIARSTFTSNGTGIEVAAIAGNNASIVSNSNVFSYHNIVFSLDGFGGTEAIFTRGNNSAGYHHFLVGGGSLTTLGPI